MDYFNKYKELRCIVNIFQKLWCTPFQHSWDHPNSFSMYGDMDQSFWPYKTCGPFFESLYKTEKSNTTQSSDDWVPPNFYHYNSLMHCLLLCHMKHKFKKNHTKIIQKATIFQSPTQQSLSNHPRDIILWNKQKNCFTCNIIAQIPHSDNCQSSKMNKYFKSIECQSKHHHMTTKI